MTDYAEQLYYDTIKDRKWNTESLGIINKNVGLGINALGDYMACSTNHLGIETLQGESIDLRYAVQILT